jgi:hypothetical protein
MNALARLLLLAVLPAFASQSLKNEDLGVDVVNKPGLFAAKVPDFSKMDLANMRAVNLGSHGEIEEWQELKHGKGTTVYTSHSGLYEGTTQAKFVWQQSLDIQHQLAAYRWSWGAGSSRQSVLVQVMELRGEKVIITQQIEANAHGCCADAKYDPKNGLLTVKAVGFAENDGHCCPSFLGVVTFRWDGHRFVRIRAGRAPIPKQD